MSEADRIAELEARVGVLTDAVQSLLKWRVSSGRALGGPQMSLIGQNETRKIMAQLDTEPADWGGDREYPGFYPLSEKHLRCDECGALVARDASTIAQHRH